MSVADDSRRVFRVTVRGQFHELSDEARRYLTTAQPEHDIFKSGYTAEGTFTYDERIDFFNLRYELRVGGDDPSGAAAAAGRREAEAFLGTMKFTHRNLKVEVVDMSAIWADVDMRRRR